MNKIYAKKEKSFSKEMHKTRAVQFYNLWQEEHPEAIIRSHFISSVPRNDDYIKLTIHYYEDLNPVRRAFWQTVYIVVPVIGWALLFLLAVAPLLVGAYFETYWAILLYIPILFLISFTFCIGERVLTCLKERAKAKKLQRLEKREKL